MLIFENKGVVVQLIKEIEKNKPRLTEWRHQIHKHPELGFEEKLTSDYIAEILTGLGIEVHRGIGGTGLVGVIEGAAAGKSIALRADMDALPMQEQTDVEYKSEIDGQSHSCGHDGHSVMLLGAAAYLATNKPKSGRVILIFQPAEELGTGAPRMIEDGLFERFPFEEIYGCHNMPLIEKGKIGMRVGGTLSSYVDMAIDIVGKGGHGAAPHTVNDPLQVAARLVTEFSSFVGRYVNPAHTATIGIGILKAGTASNITPDTAYIEGTIRSLSKEAQVNLMKRVEKTCAGFSTAYDVQVTPRFGSIGLPCVNASAQVETAATAAAAVVGAENVDTDIEPYPFADDFAFFQDKVPGAYYFIGQGGVMVHEPTYNFDDDLLPIGASVFVQIIKDKLGLVEQLSFAA